MSSQNSGNSSLVVVNDGNGTTSNLNEDIFGNDVVMSTDDLKLVASSGTTSNRNPSLTSPMSLDMEQYCLQMRSGQLQEDADESKDSENEMSMKQKKKGKGTKENSSKKKEDQLRKFAKQLYNRHVTKVSQ